MRLRIVAGNRAIGIADRRIVADEGAFDLSLHFPATSILRPGLINAHDHLHRNHYGRLGAPPYPNAVAWAHDIQGRHAAAIAIGRSRPRRDQLIAGAWKNLFAGVTSVVHHDRWEPDFERDFPIRVPNIASADSIGMDPSIPLPPGDAPFCLHVAEGTDRAAAEEVAFLRDEGWLCRRLIAVHGLGMNAASIAAFRSSGAALVWCPSSNLFLFGRTCPRALLADGIDVLIGSDSRLTGDGDLLDELRLARALGHLSDARLESAVGDTAARRLGCGLPSLEIGAPADVIVLARPLLEASAEDVLLVVVDGIVRVAHPELGPRLNRPSGDGALMRVGAVERWVSARPHEHAQEGSIDGGQPQARNGKAD